MSEKDDREARARAIANRNSLPAPAEAAPAGSPWKKILYRVILVLIYFITISFFKFWLMGWLWMTAFVMIGLVIFSSGPTEPTEFVTWAVIIIVLFGGTGYLLTLSPWRGTINNYIATAMTSLNKIAEAASNFGAQLDCLTKPTLERCTNIPQAGTIQESRKGLEITTLSAESSVAVGKTARLFASIRNDGESDATVKNARMYGGSDKNFKIATNLQCAGCAIGITNEKISKNSRRELTADIAIPCEKISKFPYTLNMEYEYSVGASLPLDVLNSRDYDAKTADKEVFLTQPAADSSSGPVRASIIIGLEGSQPLKGGTKSVLFAKLNNLGSGNFKLNSAKVSVEPETEFTITNCKVNGAAVNDINNLADPSGRYYSTDKFVSVSCDIDVKDVVGQKRFVATIDATYLYNVTRSTEMELDETGFNACSATTTTTTTTSTTTITSGR
ncbi:MAG: hypothetical protein HY515_01815 [Candidatus Aenigmarchaeota archaeon]|nr:hypothetical protein [Candidatus Aenigmarchaeota archaeon]